MTSAGTLSLVPSVTCWECAKAAKLSQLTLRRVEESAGQHSSSIKTLACWSVHEKLSKHTKGFVHIVFDSDPTAS